MEGDEQDAARGPDEAVASPPPADGAEAPELTSPEALAELVDVGQSLIGQAEVFALSLLRPWNAYQVAIALALFVLAHVMRAGLGPKIRAWMATREGWPTWRMRILVVIHQRLRAIFFVGLVWTAVLILREVTWPSRSYLLGIVATLATAWLFVAFATRLIRSVFLRRLVRYGAWIYVTLYVLGLIEETERVLDTAGFQFGEFRVSLLLVVQGIVILGALLMLARFVTTTIGIDLTGLAVLSGAIGVGLGFGLQKVVSNLVSGVIILLDKSINGRALCLCGDAGRQGIPDPERGPDHQSGGELVAYQ